VSDGGVLGSHFVHTLLFGQTGETTCGFAIRARVFTSLEVLSE